MDHFEEEFEEGAAAQGYRDRPALDAERWRSLAGVWAFSAVAWSFALAFAYVHWDLELPAGRMVLVLPLSLLTACLAHFRVTCLPAPAWMVRWSLLLGVMFVLDQAYRASEAPKRLTGCIKSFKAIGTALEMYSTDYGGEYPLSLSQLTPAYLREIPPCPAAGEDTYSLSYQVARVPDPETGRPGYFSYTLRCSGCHHRLAGILAPGYPAYTSREGLLQGP